MSEYYDRRGNPITMEQWVATLHTDRRVAQTQVGGIWISTVWLGLDHGYGHNHQPVIFETMAFARGVGWGELWSDRYSTEVQALAGHDQIVARARRHHHGWVKHARDNRRRDAKYYLKQLERRSELPEIEELNLQFWLRRRST